MIFGHNSNVSLGSVKYHVQTEDAGIDSALIDTTVYCGGRVLHRRTNNYHDLLPLNPDREEALKLRLDEQHRQVLEEIRSGVLYLPAPASPRATSPSAPPSPATDKDCRFMGATRESQRLIRFLLSCDHLRMRALHQLQVVLIPLDRKPC